MYHNLPTDTTLHNLTRMSVADFRKFRRALRILLVSGLDVQTSASILVEAYAVRRHDSEERRRELDNLRRMA